MKPHNNEGKARAFDNSHKFDCFCKKVLKNEVRKYYNEMKKRQECDTNFSDLSLHETAQLCAADDYFTTEQIFNVLGNDIIVSDERIAKALLGLNEHKRDIILLSYFLEMTDREIGEQMSLVRNTVQYQRTATLKELKKMLEEGQADE